MTSIRMTPRICSMAENKWTYFLFGTIYFLCRRFCPPPVFGRLGQENERISRNITDFPDFSRKIFQIQPIRELYLIRLVPCKMVFTYPQFSSWPQWEPVNFWLTGEWWPKSSDGENLLLLELPRLISSIFSIFSIINIIIFT